MNRRKMIIAGIIAAAVGALFAWRKSRREIVEIVKPITPGEGEPGGIDIKNIAGELEKHPSKNYGRRLLSQIKKVIIHHSATTSGSPESYARYHVKENDWPGIGYHFVIQKSGQIFQTNNLSTISYHTSGQNTRSIGIALTGDFDKQNPTAAQVDSLVSLIQSIQKELGRKLAIEGHNEHSAKSCPGDRLNVDDIERQVNEPIA
jgi:N-acetyl-anhydromuramyl-L-alanine amidase AmpD